MKIGFDIGGVLSKYPEDFKTLMQVLTGDEYFDEISMCIITDQHPHLEVCKVLADNGFMSFHRFTKYSLGKNWKYKTDDGYFWGGLIAPEDVYCADYEKYGNAAKAILIKELGINIFIDDFDGYLQWDSSLGPQPILLKVQPDWNKPYWSPNWKCEGGDFGRRAFSNKNN